MTQQMADRVTRGMRVMTRRATVSAVLRRYADGRTSRQIADETGLEQKHVIGALRNIPTAYIDRWVVDHGIFAVWCIVEIPDNCPRPDKLQRKSRSKDPDKQRQTFLPPQG